MAVAVRVDAPGGPEVMQLVEVEPGVPGRGEVLLRQRAIGVNYLDIYHRSGATPAPMPGGLGIEAAGVVEAVGEGAPFVVGDRVAYATGPIGAYASARVVPSEKLVRLPDGLDEVAAAALMLKGLTARMLLRDVVRLEAGDAIVMWPAAGGVGSILTRWAAAIDYTVIGVVGSEAKRPVAQASGCAHVLLAQDDVAEEVRALTGGGARAVFDGVGHDSFDASLAALAPHGTLALFGTASGPVTSFDTGRLGAPGSLFLTRPSISTYAGTPERLTTMAADLLDAVARGHVVIPEPKTYPLEDARAAHEALEGRRTTGSLVLTA